MAAEGTTGSTVIVCTDGLANAGLGTFDWNGTSNQTSDEFYNKVGNYAKKHGVTVNLIAIEGGKCNLDTLSRMV